MAADAGRQPGFLFLEIPNWVVVESNITISAKVGEVYFIEARTNWGAGFNTAACEIRLMSTEEGTTMLQEFAAA